MKKKKIYCGECEHFLHEDIYGHGYCETFNEERICGQLCKHLEHEHKSESRTTEKKKKNSNDMKNKILELVKSTAWFVLCLLISALALEGVFSLANRNEPAKDFSTTVFSKKGHDYLLVDTKHGVCVIHAKSCPCNKRKKKKYLIHKQIKRSHSCRMIEKAKKHINSSIEVLKSMNWLISTQKTEAIMHLDNALKELND